MHIISTHNVGMSAKKISLMMKSIGSIITATGANRLKKHQIRAAQFDTQYYNGVRQLQTVREEGPS